MSHHAAFPGRIVAVHRDGSATWAPDEDDGPGLEGIPVDLIVGAVILGAASVAAGCAWWLHRTFVVPSRPRRSR